jgi:hypothetical protein
MSGHRHQWRFKVDMTDSVQRSLRTLVVGTALVSAVTISIPKIAQANTTSTALIAAGAAAIVGALLIDSNNRPYYVNNDRRYYVSQNEATYYRSHHRTVQRQAWVPESEYPVQRNAGYRIPQQSRQGYQGNGNREDR